MYLYGKNVAKEFLKQEKKLKMIKKVYLQERIYDETMKKAFEFAKLKVEILSKSEMDHLVNGLHQGIILLVDEYLYASLEEIIDKSCFLVILDHIEDPHNLGAIIRTCAAADVDAVIIPDNRCASVTATVMKTSAGAVLNMDVVQVVNLNQTVDILKKHGFWIIGTDMDGVDYQSINYHGKIAIVIGNEGKGISSLMKKNCDFIASIPISSKVESLNASVAAGLLIYEAKRNRK